MYIIEGIKKTKYFILAWSGEIQIHMNTKDIISTAKNLFEILQSMLFLFRFLYFRNKLNNNIELKIQTENQGIKKESVTRVSDKYQYTILSINFI